MLSLDRCFTMNSWMRSALQQGPCHDPPVTLYSSSSNWDSCAHSAMRSLRMKKGVWMGTDPREYANWSAYVMSAWFSRTPAPFRK
jgi:hypothetical protein